MCVDQGSLLTSSAYTVKPVEMNDQGIRGVLTSWKLATILFLAVIFNAIRGDKQK